MVFVHPVSADIAAAIRNFDGTNDSLLPRKLSLTGFYTNIKTKTIAPGSVPFEPNSPLWSDGAHKERYISVPAGKKVVPSDSDHYQFPEHTVFIKNFQTDSIYGDSTSRFYFETRFLVLRVFLQAGSPPDTLAYGITYKWNRAQTEGQLVDINLGLDTALAITWHGKKVAKRWHYPSNSDCMQCHNSRNVLGFLTPQLNRPSKTNAGKNQLDDLFAAGVLASNPLTTHPALAAFKWYPSNDAAASDTLRARSYFAANCSQCHGNSHIDLEGAGHDFDWFTANKDNKYRPAVTDTTGKVLDPGNEAGYIGRISSSSDYPKIIYAGFPESSFVMRRIMARGDLNAPSQYQMPPLATYQIDSTAFKNMFNFICSLGKRGAACKYPADQQPDTTFFIFKGSNDATPYYNEAYGIASSVFPHAFNRSMIALKAVVVGNTITVDPRHAFAKANLYDLRGHDIPLARGAKAGQFQILAPLNPGVYILRSGRETARINLLP